MAGIVLTLPILPGKEEAWRRFCQELTESRRSMYEASRLRLGLRYERYAFIGSEHGSMAVITFEAVDLAGMFQEMLESDLPFDGWFREQIQELHGVGLAAVEHAPVGLLCFNKPQVIMEWVLSSEPENKKQ